MHTQLIADRKVVIFSQPDYEPAQQLTTVLQASNFFQVVEISNAEQELSELWDLEACDTFVVFISPADFPQAIYLTNALIKLAQNARVTNFVWVAPNAEIHSGLGRGLAKASEIAENSKLKTLILRHALVFSDLLNFRHEIKFRRTLSLPLGDNSLPWIAPEDVAVGIYRWISGFNTVEPPLSLSAIQMSGTGLAQKISDVLKRNLNGKEFALRCFATIDQDRSGKLDREEIFAYLEQLAYTQEEAEILIEQADTNQDGSIDFQEFVAGLGQHLDRILADLPCEVQYVNVPRSTVLHDLGVRGIAEKTVRAWLALVDSYDGREFPIESAESWLGRVSTPLETWLESHILDFINVYILPARGILTITEGTLNGKPALTTRMLQSDNRLLLGTRTLDNRTVEWQWAGEQSNLEAVQYETERGGQRTLKFKDNQLVGMSIQGTWLGRRTANNLLFEQNTLPRWQINLFRELGELQIEEVANLVE